MTIRNHDGGLSAGVIILADAFIERLEVDGLIDSEVEHDIYDDLHGLTIAAGFGFRRNTEARMLKDYVWRRLGFGPWEDPIASPGEYGPSKQAQKLVEREGHLYILRNHSLPGVLKIGFTCRSIDQRVRQLSSSTSIPTPFELVEAFHTPAPMSHERAVHEQLASKRLPGREFFRIAEDVAIATCKDAIGGAV